MPARSLFVLFIAVTLGALAVVLVNTGLRSPPVEEVVIERDLPTQPVVVARESLEVGTRLSAERLSLAQFPVGSVPPGSFSSIAVALGDSERPRVAVREIFAGEVVTEARVSPPASRAGLAVRIPEDKRAITIATDEVQGVAGFVLPGDRVDILHTTNSGRNDGDAMTLALLQNVEVVAVDQLASEDREDPRIARAVTLILSIEDAQRVTLAQRIGQVKLALRNTQDGVAENGALPRAIRAVDLQRVAPVPEARPAANPAAPSGFRVEVIRGLNVGVERVRSEPNSMW